MAAVAGGVCGTLLIGAPYPLHCPTAYVLEVCITPDQFWYETSWSLSSGNQTLKTGLYMGTALCLSPGTYNFTIRDDFGDGILSPGFYSLALAGKQIASGGSDFKHVKTITFNVGCSEPRVFQLEVVSSGLVFNASWSFLNTTRATSGSLIVPVTICEEQTYQFSFASNAPCCDQNVGSVVFNVNGTQILQTDAKNKFSAALDFKMNGSVAVRPCHHVVGLSGDGKWWGAYEGALAAAPNTPVWSKNLQYLRGNAEFYSCSSNEWTFSKYGKGSFLVLFDGVEVDDSTASFGKRITVNLDSDGSIKSTSGTENLCGLFSVDITPDSYPGEIGWMLFNYELASGQTLLNKSFPTDIQVLSYSGNQPIFSSLQRQVELCPGYYAFIMADAYADGICCTYGNGSYDLGFNGINFFHSNGKFQANQIVFFAVTVQDGVPHISTSQISVSNPIPSGKDDDDDDQVDLASGHCGKKVCQPILISVFVLLAVVAIGVFVLESRKLKFRKRYAVVGSPEARAVTSAQELNHLPNLEAVHMDEEEFSIPHTNRVQ